MMITPARSTSHARTKSYIKKKKRKTIVEFATLKCNIFSERILGIIQRKDCKRLVSIGKPWMACTIFCQRKDISIYYTCIELNDLGLDPYFPDGTWCHVEESQNYFCCQYYCLSEKILRFEKKLPRDQ